MRRRRLPVGLIVPALLVGLVALLATLQYRWLGKVSEAEREQLRRSLQQRAQVFAEDFDGEVSRIFSSLQLTRAAVAENDWRAFAAAVERWQHGARFPRMVRGIYLAETVGQRETLRKYDAEARAFGPGADGWPAHLAAVRARLSGTLSPPAPGPGSRPHIVSFTITPILADLPALVIPVAPSLPSPLPAMPPSPAAGARFWLQWSGAHVVVDLDGDYIRESVLPALVTRHFPGQGAEGQDLTILSAAGRPLFVGGGHAKAIEPAQADVVAPFFNLRLQAVHDRLARTTEPLGGKSEAGGASTPPPPQAGPAEGERVAVLVERRVDPPAGGATASVGAQVRVQHAGWRLLLRHPAGSVDAAVLQARRRNLWLSFGILGVLAAGVVLVVLNGRRSVQLGARQMDFVATVSHELRTPLAVIRSAAQNLSAGVVADAAQARRYGQLIEDEGRRLTDMVEQILEYSRINGDRPLRNPRPLDVHALLAELDASFGELAEGAGVSLEVEAPAEALPPVQGDEAALRRALHNLVGNALKHAAEGKWIGVAARVETVRGRRQVQVSVSDRGPGIAASELAHVFEPFYRGRLAMERQVHGNGLGLTLVKRVAEVHGGTISVKSSAGEGTRFTLHLPAAASVPAADPMADPARAAGSHA